MFICRKPDEPAQVLPARPNHSANLEYLPHSILAVGLEDRLEIGNNAITAVGGAFTWTITAATHGVTTPATVQLFEAASNEQVIANVAIAENGNVTITINGTGSLAAGTYRAVIIG